MNSTIGSPYFVRAADWRREGEILREIRFAVFVQEQGVPPEAELDQYDETCLHLVAIETDQSRAIGTARLQTLEDGSGKIGRVAVIQPWRRRGVASVLLNALIVSAEQAGISKLKLHGQMQIQPLYESLGFIAHDPIFDECGIPHRFMTRELQR